MRLPLVFATALLMCLMAVSAGAVVYVDCNAPGPVHNGASWQSAFLSISQALAHIGNGSEIWVRTGTYNERLTLNTYTTIYGGFLGHETSLGQRMIGAFPTVVSGQRRGSVITMPNGARVTLDGLTIKNGLAERGGGIWCATDAVVNIRNCRIEHCEATILGGGVYYDTYTQGTMSDCVVTNNEAPGGGGVVVQYHSYPTLNNNVIVRNRATVSGGGVYCPFHSGALANYCTIAYNQAEVNGGGIYAYYGGPETFRYCIIAFNSAPAGAGLYADGGTSSAVLTACVWYGNVTGDLGGYLFSLPPGNMTCDPLFLMPERNEFHLRMDSPCPTAGAYPVADSYALDRIGIAKLLSDGSPVTFRNKVVSAVDGDTVYLQEPDRTAGIAATGIPGASPGRIVTVATGSLSTQSGGTLLVATSSTVSDAVYRTPPVAVPIRSLSALVGVKVLTWGRITAITDCGFVLSDGDLSVAVKCPSGDIRVGDRVTVVGVLSIERVFLAPDPPRLHHR